MQIELDSASREPLYQQLANSILERIRSGALPSGTRLPTVRQFARQLGVTRLTVHSAYAELQADGWVEATVGRGTFVAEAVRKRQLPPTRSLGNEVTPMGVMSDLLHIAQLPDLTSLARADPAMQLFPLRQWQRANEMALAMGGPALLNYTTSQGELVLRATLAELLRERGLSTSPDEIIITAGVTQGIALVSEMLARPGDTVLVEQPTYLGMLGSLASRGIRAVGVPMDEHGMIVDALAMLLRTERPAFLYTIPTFQNPSGICMSPERRAALLRLAQQHNLTIVEDDIYGRLGYEGATPRALKADDLTGQVVYLGSFSKNLMPGLRLGYAVASPALIQRLVTVRQMHDMCSPPLTQQAMATFIEQGWLHSHIKRMLPHYRERRDAMLRAMECFFPQGVTWTRPRGGFSCWVSLPIGISVKELYLSAIAHGVVFVPGEAFSAASPDRPRLRLCYGAETPERITEAVATLGTLLRERSARNTRKPPTCNDYVPLV